VAPEVVESYLSQTLQDLVHQSLDDQLPRVIIEGTSKDIEINLETIYSYSGVNLTSCNFSNKRVNLENTCILSSTFASWSSIFDYDNTFSVKVASNDTEIVLNRTIPILRKLEIALVTPRAETNASLRSNYLELYLSPGSVDSGWENLSDTQIDFQCRILYNGQSQEGVQFETANSTLERRNGHFRVNCPVDWSAPDFSLDILYVVEGQNVTLNADSHINQMTSIRARKINNQTIQVTNASFSSEFGDLYCRVSDGAAKEFYYSSLVLEGNVGQCNLIALNEIAN
jgi:hypothetical protein